MRNELKCIHLWLGSLLDSKAKRVFWRLHFAYNQNLSATKPIGFTVQNIHCSPWTIRKHIEQVAQCGCFPKWWYPQIIHFSRVFHYKPSCLGYPNFWKDRYQRKRFIPPSIFNTSKWNQVKRKKPYDIPLNLGWLMTGSLCNCLLWSLY